MPDLLVAGTCDYRSLGRSIHPSVEKGVANVDLRKMTFGYPVAVVGICTFIQRAVSRGEHVSFHCPDSDDAANYLARARLARILETSGIAHDLPRVREHGVGDSLFELRAFNAVSHVEELAVHLEKIIGQGDAAAATLYTVLVASGENFIEHSGASAGYLMAQRTHRDGRVHFAVGDAGVGLLETLSGRGANNDKEALDLALQAGMSRLDARGRGNGLRELADRAVDTGGSLTLESGTYLRTESARGSSSIRHRRPIAGTLVSGSFPSAR